jgi:hypothetical protein
MNERLRWWVLPGAMIVLLRVVTLEQPDDAAAPRGTPVDANSGGFVAVLEGAGHRSGPVALSISEALVVSGPRQFAGTRCELTIWRRRNGVRESAPWLELRPLLPADAELPIAGLPAGRYDLELRTGDAGTVLTADDVAAPGRVELRAVR